MSQTMFHLGWFTKFGPPAWQAPSDRDHGGDWWDGAYFADLANQLEAACFDFVFFEDTASVARVLGGTMDADLRHALYTPKHDPMALLANLAARTERIGLVATASTSFYPPFLLARLLSSIDSLSGGRAAWNMVTSSLDDEAANYGMELPPAGERYDRAEDFVTAAKALWDSWDDGALLRDVEAGVYVDPSKVHRVDYAGPYHQVRGPLNTLVSPQRRPILVQAGASDRGRNFAAKHAEVIFGLAGGGIAAMRDFRNDIHRRMEAMGRDPRSVKIFWSAPIKITHPDDVEDLSWGDDQIEIIMAYWSAFIGTDLSQFPLDEPIPQDLTASGHSSMLEELQEMGRQGMTLRDALIAAYSGADEIGLIGTADQVADNVCAMIDEVGGDAIMIQAADVANAEYTRRITQELVPRLQDMGRVRTEYAGRTLRENLFAF